MDDCLAPNILLAAVEGGGTTFVASIAQFVPKGGTTTTDDDAISLDSTTQLEILHTVTISSSAIPPSETLSRCADFFRTHAPKSGGGYAALGVATFGPAGVNPDDAETYGTILEGSPKKEWRGVDVLTPILDACSGGSGSAGRKCPHRVETDVNAPAYAEFKLHNSTVRAAAGGEDHRRPIASLAYVTVGTGVGVGLVVNSKPVHGMMHPEGGHVTVAPLPGDTCPGYSWGTERSPYGGVNTVEGLTSSVALAERLAWEESDKVDDGKGKSGEGGATEAADRRDSLATLPDSHPVWDHAANALANLCVSLVLLTSVERIVLGGGVMKRTVLYDSVRRRTRDILNGYLELDQVATDGGLADYIGPSAWGDRAGLVGTFALARAAWEEETLLRENGKEKMGADAGTDFRRGLAMGAAVSAAIGIIGLALLGRGGRGR